MTPPGHDAGMGHLTIACDGCELRHSTACSDCVVTFVLATETALDAGQPVALDLDDDQERVVHLFTKAGLVPQLRHRAAG